MTDGVIDPRGPAKRPDPLTPEQVTEIIRRCLSAGRIIPSKHFRSQEFLRDYTIQDAISVLRWGEVSSRAPEWNDILRKWSYRVDGPDLDGDVLSVIVGIGTGHDRVVLVTAF